MGIAVRGRDGALLYDIEESAVAAIAMRSASEVDGVVVASGRAAKPPAYGRDGAAAGARVAVEGASLCFSVSVVARFGARMPELAWNLQDHVKRTVEGCVGMPVGRVDVLVAGVRED